MRTATSVIGDEMLTPDSSRFWPAEGYEPGHGQPSFDKQFARDWLNANPDNDWTLPQEIVDKTIEKYLQGYERDAHRREARTRKQKERPPYLVKNRMRRSFLRTDLTNGCRRYVYI